MMKLQDIDYTPLSKMKTGHLSTSLANKNIVGVTLILTLVVAAFVELNILLIYLGVLAVSAVIGWSAKRVMNQRNSIWRAFAEVNGWYVIKNARQHLFVPPGIAHIGSDRRMSDVVHATIEGHECDLFVYEFTEATSRMRNTHYFTVARVLLERPFPHLILDSKHTYAIVDRGSTTAKVKLEGNFDQHFSLYHRVGDHVNALSIITPDVMQTLLRSNQSQDIEIIDNYLFFIASSDQRSAAALPALLQSVDALADEIAHKAKTIQYQPEVTAPNVDMWVRTLGPYFRSGDKVLNNIWFVILILFVMPLIFAVLSGVYIYFRQ